MASFAAVDCNDLKECIPGCLCILQDWYVKLRHLVTVSFCATCQSADCILSRTPKNDMFDLSSAAKLLQVDDGNRKSGIIVKVMLCF